MLTLGSKGVDVVELQKLLTACGFTCAADGNFGPKTKKVLLAAQKSAGVQATGKYDDATRKALLLWAQHKAQGVNISTHFRDTEFSCHDGSGQVRIHPKLPKLLEKIRVALGKPITVNSGYRTPSYNAKIGGAKNSYHMKGMAADIVVPGVSPKDVATLARKMGAGGVGVYPNFTHVDVGPVRSWAD